MKSRLVSFRNLHLAASLAVGMSFGNVAWSKPAIQSIEVSPNPLISGQTFTIVVAASLDVTQAIASLDFHQGKQQSLAVLLTKQGAVWTGISAVPADLDLKQPDKGEAKITVLVVDGSLRQDENAIRVAVNPPTISAVFAGGILTITGDDNDNTLTASRDIAGTILVNGGT